MAQTITVTFTEAQVRGLVALANHAADGLANEVDLDGRTFRAALNGGLRLADALEAQAADDSAVA